MNNISQDFAAQLKAIIDTAIDGILTIDQRGKVESMNPAAASLFGYEVDEVIGNNIKLLMPNPYQSEHDDYIERYNRTKEPRIIGIGREVQGLRKDGSIFPFRLAVSEVLLNDRVIFTGVVHDLSDVKKAQEEIVSLNKALEQKVSERTVELEETVNKLLSTNRTLEVEMNERILAEQRLRGSEEELKVALSKEKELGELKSRFVSMASHEFRTPLTSILSSAAIIQRYTKEDQQPNREKHIERIKSSVTNLTGILNDLLSLSRLEEGKVEVEISEINFNELCEEVIAEFGGLLKEGQHIKHSVQGIESHVHVDKRILKNILFNLMSNAIKYSEKDVICDVQIEKEQFVITIKDQGIGIPEEDQKHLFTRFFRAGNVTNIQGTGLGLNIVQRYVSLLEGAIAFESEHEVGTTFKITIPNQSK